MPSFPKHKLAAPFPWFGGKVMQSDLVWQGLGEVQNYIEPFAGSLGVLLNRPAGWVGVETVNDLDCMIANFWRAVKSAPEEVDRWCDYPVSEIDLHARHDWLIARKPSLRGLLRDDPRACCAQTAGWWAWGISQWIGRGWCAEVSASRPHLGDNGKGVHSFSHKGVALLARRLRRVSVLNGDWARAVSSGALRYGRHVAIYLDPPYAASADRDGALYAEDSATVADDVRRWAVGAAEDPRLRIAIAGYAQEWPDVPDDWIAMPWKTHGPGYEGQAKNRSGNHGKEVVWFSPSCAENLRPRQGGLFT